MKHFLFIAAYIFSTEIFAESWAIRAREHFESHSYEVNGEDYKYLGLTNTINLWREEPYRYAYGLALGPVIGSAAAEDKNPGLGDDIRLWVLGAEAKYFPTPGLALLFTRLGFSHLILQTLDKGLADPAGQGYYAGLGYEFKTQKLGVAPEIAYRYADLSGDTTGKIITFSIGFHFY